MVAPILATKLHVPPPRPDVVLRSRLLARLNEGAGKKLTLVSAPAGFGKTTLVSEWIAGRGRAVAWLSLDERDGDVVRFLTYLLAALRSVAPDVGAKVEEALRAAPSPSVEPLLTELLNDVAAVPDDIVLVLDDYHAVDAGPIDDAVGFLLEHLPAHLHLILTTREDPDLPLARLRVRGNLVEIRAADLRFTEEESAAFLNEVMDLRLSAGDVASLETRTEGWIAGLQLAALSMRGRDDASSFVRAFAGNHRYVVDYLVEEVLARQPEHVRRFLLHTSVLEHLSGSLCDAVTGQERCGALLETLERGNLFLVSLDDRREWFRYHHLFADVLRAHLVDEQPGVVPRLHALASAWFEANGHVEDAVRHALASEDYQRAAELIERQGPVLRGSYRNTTLLAWLRAVPDQVLRSRPVLSVEHARASTEVGDFETGEARLRDAEAWLEGATAAAGRAPHVPGSGEDGPAADTHGAPRDPDARLRAVAAKIATARTFLAQARGDVAGTVHYARRALELLPADDAFERGVIASLSGLAHWTSGALEDAHRSLETGLDGIRAAGNVMVWVGAQHMLADVRVAQGRLGDAIATYERALRVAAEQPEPVILGTANLHLGWSQVLHERGEREAAAAHLATSEELGEAATLPDTRFRWCVAHAAWREDEGDLEGALELLDEAERLYYPTPIPDVRSIAALRARLRLRRGDIEGAFAWAHERGLAADDAPSYLREFEHLTLARVLIARHERDPRGGDAAGALALLRRLLAAADAGERKASAIECLIVTALAHHAMTDESAALVALERALHLAAPEGYVRRFVVEGAPVARLLSRAEALGLQARYVRRLLAAFPRQGTTPVVPLRVADRADDALVEPLSARELEVLRLIAEGLSNDDIARRLFRALPTIKGYNRSIFAKLQVQRRTEAVARAHELGLL